MSIHKALLPGFITAVVLLAVSFHLLRSHYIEGKISAASVDNSDLFLQANKALDVEPGESLIILFGDSRVARWDPLPSVPKALIVNRGISGETTSQMTERFDSDVLNLRPSAVVIQAGINDLVIAGLQPSSAAEIRARVLRNIESFVKLASDVQINVVVLTIILPADPPWYRKPVWSKKIQAYVEEVNSSIRTLPKRYPVTILDAAQILRPDLPVVSKNYAVDTLHINEKAYRQINLVLTQLLLSNNAI